MHSSGRKVDKQRGVKVHSVQGAVGCLVWLQHRLHGGECLEMKLNRLEPVVKGSTS